LAQITDSLRRSKGLGLAQVGQSETHFHKCTTCFDRNLNTTDDYEKIMADGVSGGGKYVDVNFPIEDALYWYDAGEIGSDMDKVDEYVTWMRVSDSSFPGKSFWGPNKKASDITPTDINQGYIGNCWIMAAVSALAEHDHRIDEYMVSDKIDYENGIYAMNFYSLGVPYTQIIDDRLPMNGNNTIFAGLGKDGSVWMALVEKFYAKWYGNYQHLVGGWMAYAVSALNGSPFIEIQHNQANAD